MGKGKGKFRKSFIIVTSLLFITFTLSFFIFIDYNSYQKLYSENIKLNNEVKKLENKYKTTFDEHKELEVEEESLTNLKEDTLKLKEDVFSLAKELENKIVSGESDKKIAYLTFDDGPYYSTLEVLDILDKYKVKATFFTIGLDKDICYDNKGTSCADTYKLIVDKGHTIANHTYTHAIRSGLYSSINSFITAVKDQESLIEKRTGYKTNIVRFPGGSGTAKARLGNYNTEIAISKLREMGYGWTDWTAGDGDGGYLPNTTIAWDNFTKTINENIEVVLFHDYSRPTIEILPDAISYLENNGYILLPLFYDSVKINK